MENTTMTDDLRANRSRSPSPTRRNDDATPQSDAHNMQSQARAASSTGLGSRAGADRQERAPTSRIRSTLTQLSSSLASRFRPAAQPAQAAPAPAPAPITPQSSREEIQNRQRAISSDIQQRQVALRISDDLIRRHPGNQMYIDMSADQKDLISLLQSELQMLTTILVMQSSISDDVQKNPGTAATQQLDDFVNRGEKFTTEKRDPQTHEILYKPEEVNPKTGEITRKANTIAIRVKDDARIKHMHEQIEIRVKQQLSTANAVGENNVSTEAKTARGELMLAAMELIDEQLKQHSSNMALVSRLIHEVDKDFPLPEGHPKSGQITLEDAAKCANNMLAFGGFDERVKPEVNPKESESEPTSVKP
jgi:hypothetical protein